jgi:energy-coupling factor transport system ATP-binding protein
VLEDVSLRLGPGEVLGVVGRSGCGKSTMLLAASGIVPRSYVGRSKGSVHAFGQRTADVRPADLCDRIGMVFQSPDDQLTQLKVWREVGFGPANQGCRPEEVFRRIDWAMETVGIADLRDRDTNALSGGQKQKVALAAALAMKPRLLVLDEPTTDLDPVARQEILAAVRKIRAAEEMAIVVVSHEVDLISELAERFVLVEAGRIVRDQPAEAFFRDSATLREVGLEVPQVVELNGLMHAERGDWPLEHRYGPTLRLLRERLGPAGGGGQAGAEELAVGRNGAGPGHGAPAVSAVGAPVVELDGVGFAYPGQPTPALSGVSLAVGAGEFVAVVGANGSGKTTLTKLVLGLAQPTAGRVRVMGRPLSKRDPDRVGRVGYVFQNPDEMLFNPTVFEEVEFGLKVRGDGPERRRARVEQVLAEMGLGGLRSRHPLALSKGQRQRLAYAAVLAPDPPLLVFDEPTTGLDHGSCEAVMATVEELNRQGRTILFVTHDLNLVVRHARRIVVMGDGRVRFDGTPRQLMALGPERLRSFRLVPPAASRLAHESGVGLPGDVLSPEELYRAVRGRVGAHAPR